MTEGTRAGMSVPQLGWKPLLRCQASGASLLQAEARRRPKNRKGSSGEALVPTFSATERRLCHAWPRPRPTRHSFPTLGDPERPERALAPACLRVSGTDEQVCHDAPQPSPAGAETMRLPPRESLRDGINLLPSHLRWPL